MAKLILVQRSEVSSSEKHSEQKVSDWCNQIDKLSTAAKTQSQAAHSLFVHAVNGTWTYTIKTTTISLNSYIH